MRHDSLDLAQMVNSALIRASKQAENQVATKIMEVKHSEGLATIFVRSFNFTLNDIVLTIFAYFF